MGHYWGFLLGLPAASEAPVRVYVLMGSSAHKRIHPDGSLKTQQEAPVMPHGGPSLPRHPSPSTLSRIQRPQGAGIRSLDVTKFEVCVGRLLDGHEGKSPSSKPLAQFQQPGFGFASLPARPCLPDCGAHRQSQRRRPRQVQGRKQERR